MPKSQFNDNVKLKTLSQQPRHPNSLLSPTFKNIKTIFLCGTFSNHLQMHQVINVSDGFESKPHERLDSPCSLDHLHTLSYVCVTDIYSVNEV